MKILGIGERKLRFLGHIMRKDCLTLTVYIEGMTGIRKIMR